MSRIGRLPVVIPAGVTVDVKENNDVTVKGPKGTLTRCFAPQMKIEVDAGVIHVGLCLAGSAMFGFGLGAVSNMLLSRHDLV